MLQQLQHKSFAILRIFESVFQFRSTVDRVQLRPIRKFLSDVQVHSFIQTRRLNVNRLWWTCELHASDILLLVNFILGQRSNV